MSGILRKYATPLCIGAFILIGLSGSMMFFGVKNGQLIHMHEIVGICFVVIAILHLVRNWKPFGILLRQKSAPWIIGVIAVCGLVIIGSSFSGEAGGGRGNPHFGMAIAGQQLANAPLDQLAAVMHMSPEVVRQKLAAGGVKVAASDKTLSDVARSSGWQVGQLFILLAPNGGHRGGASQHGNH